MKTTRSHLMAGFTLVEMSIVVAIMSFIIISKLAELRSDVRITQGKAQGEVMKLLSNALNSYSAANQVAIINGTPIAHNGCAACAPVLAPGNVVDNTAPTLSELKALGFVNLAFSSANFYGSDPGYNWSLTPQPVGCLPVTCSSIETLTWLTNPVKDPSTNRVDGVVIGEIQRAAGGGSGASLLTPAFINFTNGALGTRPNPVGGTPAGIVAVLGSSNGMSGGPTDLTALLPRDGSRPMTGTLNTSGNPIAMGGGNVTGAGAVTAASVSTTGAVNVGGDEAVTGNSSVTGNSAIGGNSVISGLVTANQAQLNAIVTENTACPSNGMVARNATGLLLSCQSLLWKKASGSGTPIVRASDVGDALAGFTWDPPSQGSCHATAIPFSFLGGHAAVNSVGSAVTVSGSTQTCYKGHISGNKSFSCTVPRTNGGTFSGACAVSPGSSTGTLSVTMDTFSGSVSVSYLAWECWSTAIGITCGNITRSASGTANYN